MNEGREVNKKNRLSSKLGYVGAGIGLALYAIFGLMPGAYLGGVLGLNMVNAILGVAAEATVLHRVMTAVGMLTGVMVAGMMFTVSGGCLGWLSGMAVDAMRKAEEEPQKEQVSRESSE
jgi:hypothetical protein